MMGTSPYQVILLDPPWNETGGGKVKRGADRHYPLMKTRDIKALLVDGWDIPGQAADDSACFLWVTNNFLPDGLEVMDALGFRYVTNLVWTKDRFGLGYYFRGQHELCLFGVKGKLGRARATHSTWLGQDAIARRKHSQKPDELHAIIESLYDGPYLECFARSPRDGWDALGNEVDWQEGS
jgi:N6-adenosine-specific RNA methylase IME4